MNEKPLTTVLDPNFLFNPKLQLYLTGRQLLLEEIPYSIEEINQHFNNGYVFYREGIVREKGLLRCNRCNNQDGNLFGEYPCSRCGKKCFYCRKCIMMGRISTCSKLVCWSGPSPEEIGKVLKPLEWSGTLSVGQKAASDKAVEAVERDHDILIWAVCGSGKTEILFAAIQRALQQRKRICLATPRTDVVLELTPRLKNVFPSTPIASLFGGSDDRHQYAPLTIATTHQLLRFYQAFDMMIIDEVDAFPYTADQSLQFAVGQARKAKSSLLFLTATPNEKWQRECRLGKRNYVTIPARFHRFPLPVPTFAWCGNWKKKLMKNQLPATILEWAKIRINEEKQALIFFPNIRLMERALPIFRGLSEKIEAVHAEDPLRKEKVLAMRNLKMPVLLTTTILERGVTFPNLDVAVVGAEEDIFTESALVQIAGRVGRSALFPSGNITYFHYGKSLAMVKAQNQINQMNLQAKKKGLLNEC
ncbi:DEAD/DEAH box helicase [Pseudoneobacillus sp. C159]